MDMKFTLFGKLHLVPKCMSLNPINYHLFRRFNSGSNHYEVLKLSQSCSQKDIREAFLILSKQNHPDRHLNDPSMHNKFIRIKEAYSVLINPTTRRSYDMVLGNEKKLKSTLNESNPHARQYTHNMGSHNVYETWDYQDPTKKNEHHNDHSYYGVYGIKKVSNAIILFLLFIVTFVGVGLQLLVIRHSFLRNHEKMLEETQRNSMYLSIAREKAKLYGNDHQIEILKKSLKATLKVEPPEELPIVSSNSDEVCEKCNKKKQE